MEYIEKWKLWQTIKAYTVARLCRNKSINFSWMFVLGQRFDCFWLLASGTSAEGSRAVGGTWNIRTWEFLTKMNNCLEGEFKVTVHLFERGRIGFRASLSLGNIFQINFSSWLSWTNRERQMICVPLLLHQKFFFFCLEHFHGSSQYLHCSSCTIYLFL